MPDVFADRTVLAEGHTLAYHDGGPREGPVVVLLHGLASSAETWDMAAVALAARGVRVIVPDLLGHGRSDKPAGKYTLDDFAGSLEAFFDALSLTHVTLGGHSLGGAIAVRTAAAHPDRVARLVLVSAGGLGREVHPVLRAAALPVAPVALRMLTRPALWRVYRNPRLHRALRLTPDNLVNLRRAAAALATPPGQASFFAALRAVVDPRGQRGSLVQMRALTADVPALIVWNAGDPVIPVAHAHCTHAQLPGSTRLVIFDEKGHEPHRRSAERFADEVIRFLSLDM